MGRKRIKDPGIDWIIISSIVGFVIVIIVTIEGKGLSDYVRK